VVILILLGLNWWLEPLQYHPEDPKSCSHQILKFLIKSSPTEPISAHQLSNTIVPDSTDNEAASMMKYYQMTQLGTNDVNKPVLSDNDTKL